MEQNCLSVTDGAFKKISTVKRETWKCPSCKVDSVQQSDAASSPVGDSLSQQLPALNVRLDSLRTTVSALMVKTEELLSVHETSEKVALVVKDMQPSIDYLSSRYDSVLS